MPKKKMPQNPLLQEKKKLKLPGEKKNKRKWLARGLGVGLAVAGALGGERFLNARKAKMQEQRQSYEHFIGQEKYARNPRLMSKISMIYGWSPVSPEGLRRISFLDSISKKTGLSEKKVMRTIEVNPLNPSRVTAIKNKLSLLERNPKGKSQEIERVKRVLSIVESAVKIDGKFANTFGKEVRTGKGTRNKINNLKEE